MNISEFYEYKWCKININDNNIQVDHKKLIKFFIDSDIKQLDITLYNGWNNNKKMYQDIF